MASPAADLLRRPSTGFPRRSLLHSLNHNFRNQLPFSRRSAALSVSARFRLSQPQLAAADQLASPSAADVRSDSPTEAVEAQQESAMSFAIGSRMDGLRMVQIGLGDRAFTLLGFIAVLTSVAFTSLVVAAIPTLLAMKRAATSLARLADTAREELPSTMAAIRLSGMEISDLTLELSDLSQEIAGGLSKSAEAVQATKAGIQQMGAIARQQTILMIEERANLPETSIQPVVVGAARKASRLVGKATNSLKNFLSQMGDQERVTSRIES